MTEPITASLAQARDLRREPGLPLRVLVALGALTAVAPLVTDLYLPALPDLARSLGTSEPLAQATVSVCLVGLSLGQLFVGPLSDRVGRMRPLRWGVALLAVTSFLCAVADEITVLLVLRLLQGLAGSAALVIARAIVRDVYDGARAAKVFSELMLIMGLAPVVGPVVGGQLLRFTDWRGIFVTLGLLTTALLVGCWLVLHETVDRRAVDRPDSHPLRVFRTLLSDGRFVGYLALMGLMGIILFSYISMSSFVLRGEYDVRPVGYSFAFGANAIGMVVGSQVSARLVIRRGPAALLRAGVALLTAAAAAVVAALAAGAPLALVLLGLWFVLFALGMSFGNATALALSPHGAVAGTAAALLGASQFLLGAAVPPLVSLLGTSGVVMGTTMVTAAALALATLFLVIQPGSAR